MFKRLTKQRIAFEIIQDLIVSIALTVSALCASRSELSFVLVAKESCFAWLINVVIGVIVPEREIGSKLSSVLKLNKKVVVFLFQLLVIVLINVVGISVCVVLKNTGLNERFSPAWINLVPMLILVDYIVALICFPLTNRIVNAIFGKEP